MQTEIHKKTFLVRSHIIKHFCKKKAKIYLEKIGRMR